VTPPDVFADERGVVPPQEEDVPVVDRPGDGVVLRLGPQSRSSTAPEEPSRVSSSDVVKRPCDRSNFVGTRTRETFPTAAAEAIPRRGFGPDSVSTDRSSSSTRRSASAIPARTASPN